MFYICSIIEEFRRTGTPPADFARLRVALQPLEGGGGVDEISRQPQKRSDAVESGQPRKRGGQPDNRNAVKTGWNTAEAKRLRSMVWQFRRRTKSILLAINADLVARTE